MRVRLIAPDDEIARMYVALLQAAGSERVEAGAEVTLLAVPAALLRETLREIRPGPADRIVLATRGLDPTTGRRLSTLVEEESACLRVGAIAGPILADEIKRGSPCAAVVASRFDEVAEATSQALHSSLCRVYPSHDLPGVELAGAMVEVVAAALGAARGLGLGVGTQALVVSRGIAEGTRLARRTGGDPRTFSGLAGVGELVACVSSPDHPGMRTGLALARGEIQEPLAGTCKALLALERDLPITAGVLRVARGEVRAADVIAALLAREVRDEFDG